MIRNAFFAVAFFAVTAAQAQSDMLQIDRDEGVVIEPTTGARFPVIASGDGTRPSDCPPGAFWTEELQIGAVVENCEDGSRYEVTGSGAAAVWGLWPKPVDDDEAGPRVEE